MVGHVALALVTREDPGPPPSGTIFLLQQLFVRAGVARNVMALRSNPGKQRLSRPRHGASRESGDRTRQLPVSRLWFYE